MAARHAAENWKGQVGDRWLNFIDKFENMLAPIGEAAMTAAGVQIGDTVADVGCGGGMNSLGLAARVGPQGHVTGLDIAPQLIGKASKRAAAEGVGNVSFECGDCQFHTPAQAPFDRVFSRFGVMFFDDTLAGFRNMRSWLKPGGELFFATWAAPKDNPWMSELGGIVSKYVEVPQPDPDDPGPFRLADREKTTAMLEKAGFRDISITQWTGDQPLGGPGNSPAEALAFVLHGLEIEKTLADLNEAARGAAIAEISAMLERNYRDGSVAMQASALFVRARA